MSTEVMLKATPFQAVLTYAKERLGEARLERVLAGLSTDFPDAVKKAREGRFIAFELFPLAFTTQLIERTAAELREPAVQIAHEMGRRGAEAATAGVLRLALIMISIPSLLRKLAPAWSQLYTQGRMTYQDAGDRKATIEVHDFPYVSPTHCARVTGSFEWFAQKAEKTATVRHISCRARGGDACRWEVAW